jgi:hypothetical protein
VGIVCVCKQKDSLGAQLKPTAKDKINFTQDNRIIGTACCKQQDINISILVSYKLYLIPQKVIPYSEWDERNSE